MKSEVLRAIEANPEAAWAIAVASLSDALLDVAFMAVVGFIWYAFFKYAVSD